MSIVLKLLKDSLLCLVICTTLANMRKNKKYIYVSLGIIIISFLMGLDVW